MLNSMQKSQSKNTNYAVLRGYCLPAAVRQPPPLGASSGASWTPDSQHADRWRELVWVRERGQQTGILSLEQEI
jgi:hypothetical protein